MRHAGSSRLESFSDAAFALALTLPPISAGVPRSHAELRRLVHRIPSFACCSALPAWIWNLAAPAEDARRQAAAA